MEQNKNTAGGVPVKISDLLKLFVKKLKLMVVIGLIAAIIGGAFGGWVDAANIKYEAEMNISVTPADETDVLLFDLRSGAFAEKLLLEENGLPAKDKCDPEDYDAAVKALDEYEQAREKRREKYYELSYYYMAPIENEYKNLNNDYEEVKNLLKLYKETPLEGLDRDERERHLQMIEVYEEKLEIADAARSEYKKNVYDPAQTTKVQLQTELSQTKDVMEAKKREADKAVEKVLSAWRSDAEIQEQVIDIIESVSYEYFTVDKPVEEDSSDKETVEVNKGFIRILISVPNDEDLANGLVERFRLHLTDYVEKHLEYVTGEVEVDCSLINPIVPVERTPGSLIPGIIKTAIVFGAVAVVATYLVSVLRLLLKASEKREDDTSL